MARLSHPNVVTVHDVGLSESRIFIAMELVEGLTLREFLAQDGLPWPKILDVLLQAGEGLVAAHEAGLVHRDFKPSNVLVGPGGRARVLDFGLARRPVDLGAAGERSSSDPATSGRSLIDEAMTQSGTVLGTPAYMAPEQWRGGMVDARADEFAFCVTAFEAFFGARPFRGKGDDLRDAILQGRVVVPGGARKVPARLERAILRGLAVDPAERYPSMRALLDALASARHSGRRRPVAVVSVIGALGLAAGGAFVLSRPPPPPDARVDDLVHAAHEAAARSHFVYPSPAEPDGATAYLVVLKLEALEGELDAQADEAAAQLRDEFTSTLIGLGDRYFELEGGAPFATDYYAQALLFDPANARALERVVMTPGQLASLRDKAEVPSFTDTELKAARVLAAFAQEDPEAREDVLAEVYGDDARPGVITSAQVEALLGERSARALADRSRTRAAPKPVRSESPEPSTAAATPSEASAGLQAQSAPRRPTSSVAAEPRRDPEGSSALVRRAKAAMRSGALAQAESLLHQALAADRRNATALITLSELHYQKSDYRDAAKYALEAVELAPSRGAYRIQLGDAYFKLLRYAQARKQYESAADHGDARAQERLARVRRKLGP